MRKAREQNIKDVGRQVFEVDVESFFARILPSVDDTEVISVFDHLRTSGTLDQDTNEWVHFKNAGQPKQQLAYEAVVFSPIGDLAREIIKFVCDGDSDKEPRFIYDSRPESAPESSICQNSSQPDGYFVLKTAATDLETFENVTKPRWRNLTLISEFKKVNNAEARDDVRFLFLPYASLTDDGLGRVQSSLGNEAHDERGPP